MTVSQVRIQQRYQQIKAHYLRTHTELQWQQVTQKPHLFNRAWNVMLGLPANDMPPPLHYRT